METGGRYAWMYEDTPELALFADDAARDQAMKRMRKRLLGVWFWLYAAALAGSASLLVGPGLALVTHYAGFIPQWVFGLATVLGYVIAFYVGFALFWNEAIRRELRRQLVDQGIAVCLQCGYDCRATVGRPCPECGKACSLESPLV